MLSWIRKFFKRECTPKTGVHFDYCIEASNIGDILPIEILKGKYKGTIYSYNELKMSEDSLTGEAYITYNVNVIKHGDGLIAEYNKDKKFTELTRQILITVMQEANSNHEDTDNNYYDDDRESYFEEPVPKRTVHKKNPTIH